MHTEKDIERINGVITHKDRLTPKYPAIFVFGSNLAGRHAAGAARTACFRFGAAYGVGQGRTGNAYAFVTRIGCGLTGFADADIAPMFRGAPNHCDVPEEWEAFL